jgi:Zn-finger nucleic acid-binding protein
LPAEGRACSYCAAEITLEERGLSGVCPGCSARLCAGARFCMECGLEIQPQRLSALRDGVACPRCRGALRVREIGSASAIECASCAGLWIAQAQLDALCTRAESEELAAQALGFDSAAPAAAPLAREGYIPCLSCGELMLRKNFGGTSGVVVDLCKHHGVWLDHRELARVLAYVRGGGLVRAREREVARLEREAERARASAQAPQLGSDAPDPFEFGGRRRRREPDLIDGLAWLAGVLLRGKWR